MDAGPRPWTTTEQQVNPIMRYFDYEHLPAPLAAVSRHFWELATLLERELPNGPEKSTALRKLLEGKDAAVRAALDLPVPIPE